MNRRDLLHRLIGVAALLAAGEAAPWHRQMWNTHAAGPASGLEAALGIMILMLASLGMLLLIHGAKLRDGWVRDCARAAARREARPIKGRGARAKDEQAREMAIAAMHLAGSRGT